MPTKMDISDDERDITTDVDEFEQEGQEEGQDGGSEKKGEQRTTAELASTQAALARLTQSLQVLTQQVAGTKTTREEQVSEAEKSLRYLINSGFKPEQLEAMVTYVEAVKKDIAREVESKYRQEEQKKNTVSLDQQCYQRGLAALEKLVDGSVIADDDELKQAFLIKIQKAMQTHPDLETARNAYAAGTPPTQKDFEKAARLVLQKAPKEFGMNARDNQSPQLDVKNSRLQSHPAISKNGTVDEEKLTDYEREIYTATLNITKNKEIALKALREIAPQLRR